MINKMRRALVLGLTALVLSTGLPMPAVNAADSESVHTTVEVSGRANEQVVTYKLDLDKVSVTDGRVAVTYDNDLLTLTSDGQGISFSDADLNKEYQSGEEKGVSYAFVNDEAQEVEGNVLTLTFLVAADAQEQDTTVKTYIFSIGNDAEGVVSNETLEDVVKVGGEEEVPEGKFVTKWGSLYYELADGTKLKGLHTIEGNTYFFKESNGAAVKNDYVTIDGDKYYFDGNCHMITGFMTKWGSTRYFAPSGKMAVDMKFTAEDGYTYYATEKGPIKKDAYVVIGESKYYFGKDGRMVTGFLEKWNATYYFDEDGVQVAGKVVTVDDSSYYFNEKGTMVKDKFVDLEDGTHYFDNAGKMVKNTTITRWFKKYTFDENGVLVD